MFYLIFLYSFYTWRLPHFHDRIYNNNKGKKVCYYYYGDDEGIGAWLHERNVMKYSRWKTNRMIIYELLYNMVLVSFVCVVRCDTTIYLKVIIR